MSEIDGSTRTGMIRALIADGIEESEIARRVIAALTPEEIDAIVLSAITQVIRGHHNRSGDVAVGITESAASGHYTPEYRKRIVEVAPKILAALQDEPSERMSRNAALLESTFTIPRTGEVVKFRDATIAQHEEQKERWETIMVGAHDRAHRHIRAISEIRAAGVSTLGDIVELRHANEKAIEPAKTRKVEATA